MTSIRVFSLALSAALVATLPMQAAEDETSIELDFILRGGSATRDSDVTVPFLTRSNARLLCSRAWARGGRVRETDHSVTLLAGNGTECRTTAGDHDTRVGSHPSL